MIDTEMYRQVRAALSRAQEVFGDAAPAAAPDFAAPADLEDEVGRGAF